MDEDAFDDIEGKNIFIACQKSFLGALTFGMLEYLQI